MRASLIAEIPHREIATVDAAMLVLGNLERVLRDVSSAKKQITAALTPAFGIRWGAQIVRKINSKRLCDILWSLGDSKLEKSNYQRILTLRKDAKKSEPSCPAAWGDWRSLIEKYNLDDVTNFPEWSGAIADLTKLGWASPTKLAQSPSDLLKAGFNDGPKKFLAFHLWRAATLSWGDTSSAGIARVHEDTDNAELLIARLKRSSICARAVSRDIKRGINLKATKKIF